MHRRLLTHAVAILLLLLAGATVYACDVSDACVSSASGEGCDEAGGDACICCCHHIVPVMVLALERGEAVFPGRPADPAVRLVTTFFSIDHPPQL